MFYFISKDVQVEIWTILEDVMCKIKAQIEWIHWKKRLAYQPVSPLSSFTSRGEPKREVEIER